MLHVPLVTAGHIKALVDWGDVQHHQPLDVDQLLHHLEACWLTLCKSLKEFESLISFLKHFPSAMSSKVYESS